MNFYHLRSPDYQSDQASDAANPLTELASLIMPGLTCSACGSTWAGNRKLYLPIPKEAIHFTLENKPFKTEEWQKLAEAVRKNLNLAPDFLLMPGDRLGHLITSSTEQSLGISCILFQGEFLSIKLC